MGPGVCSPHGVFPLSLGHLLPVHQCGILQFPEGGPPAPALLCLPPVGLEELKSRTPGPFCSWLLQDENKAVLSLLYWCPYYLSGHPKKISWDWRHLSSSSHRYNHFYPQTLVWIYFVSFPEIG